MLCPRTLILCKSTKVHVFECVLQTSDLTSPDYNLDSTAGAWPQQVKFTLPRHLFTHLGFQSVRAVLSITFIPGFVMIMD